jgi:glycerol-3-phosphate cytidylyltransferase
MGGGGQRLAYAPGVYDLFHIGHLNLLRNARRACDRLIAGVLTDEMAARAKGSDPVVPIEERLAIVGSIRFVDEAVAEDVPHKLQMWERLRFDVIIKGDDWRGTERGNRLEADFAPVGVEVVYVPYTQRTSSTMLRQVLHREIEQLATAAGDGNGGSRAATHIP